MPTYPAPAQGGPPYLKYIKHRKNWKEITVTSTFEDKGVDTNESADDMPQRWTLEYDGLTETQVATLDSWNDTYKRSGSFDFQEPRNEPWTTTGSTITGVRIEDYEDGNHTKVWINKRIVHLIKYPS